LAKSWKGGHSSLGPMTHWSAADDRDGLRLHGQCLGWGVGERSAPPRLWRRWQRRRLDVSGSDFDGGAPPTETTSA
jgi:hypothetical protein